MVLRSRKSRQVDLPPELLAVYLPVEVPGDALGAHQGKHVRVVVVGQLEEASDERHAGGRAGRPVATAGWRQVGRRRVGGRNLLEGGRLSPHSRTSHSSAQQSSASSQCT